VDVDGVAERKHFNFRNGAPSMRQILAAEPFSSLALFALSIRIGTNKGVREVQICQGNVLAPERLVQ
jgi:hypothetical protein